MPTLITYGLSPSSHRSPGNDFIGRSCRSRHIGFSFTWSVHSGRQLILVGLDHKPRPPTEYPRRHPTHFGAYKWRRRSPGPKGKFGSTDRQPTGSTLLELVSQDPKSLDRPLFVKALSTGRTGWLFSLDVKAQGHALILGLAPTTKATQHFTNTDEYNATEVAVCASVARRLHDYIGAPVIDPLLASGWVEIEWPNLMNDISIGCNSGDYQKQTLLRTRAEGASKASSY